MQPTPAFAECYPQEIVDWIAAFPEPVDMTPNQHRIVKIIDDPRTIAAAGQYFSTLNERTTPEDAVSIINRFIALIKDTAKPSDITGAFLERLTAVH